jgi:hypothetical protein
VVAVNDFTLIDSQSLLHAYRLRGTMAHMEPTEPSLREQLASQGIVCSFERQRHWHRENIKATSVIESPAVPVMPGLEVTYLEPEYIESAPAPL